MPITQSRMDALLSAGEQFELLWFSGLDLVMQAVQSVQSGSATAEQALQSLALSMSASPTRGASTVLALERQHLRLTRNKNARDAQRKQRQRDASRSWDYRLGQDLPLGLAPVQSGGPSAPDPVRTAAEIAAEADAGEDLDLTGLEGPVQSGGIVPKGD